MNNIINRLYTVLRHLTRSSGGSTVAKSADDTRQLFTTGANLNSTGDSSKVYEITSHYINTNGANFHYEKTGVGKVNVLLIPGALGCGRTDFAVTMKTLNRDIFTLYAWDPRGFGRSRPPDRDWPQMYYQRDARDAAAFIEAVGIKPCNVIGWSDGAVIALILAANRPELVKKLLTFGGNAYIDNKDVEMYENVRDLSKWSEKMKRPYVEEYGLEYFARQWNDWADALTKYLTENNGDICKGDIGKIACPTLIIHGQKDQMVGQNHADYLYKHIPGAKLINWPDAKHNLHMRYPDEFNSLAEEFFLES